MLYAVFLELFVSDFYLLFGHTVFCVLGGIHYLVVESEVAAGIVTAAHSLLKRRDFLIVIYVGEVVEVDDCAEFSGKREVLFGGNVGRKHNFLALKAYLVGHHKFGQRRAVDARAFLFEYLKNIGVGRSLNRKKFFESFIPRESFFEQSCVFSYAFFVVDMKRRGVFFNYFFYLV